VRDVGAHAAQERAEPLVDGGGGANGRDYHMGRVSTALGCVLYLHSVREPTPTQGELVRLNSLVVSEGALLLGWALPTLLQK